MEVRAYLVGGLVIVELPSVECSIRAGRTPERITLSMSPELAGTLQASLGWVMRDVDESKGIDPVTGRRMEP